MFGLFKSKSAPTDPVDIIGSVEISRTVHDIYAMMDFASESNAKRAMGWHVAAVEGASNRFEMVMPHMSEITFDILVCDAVPGQLYSFDCVTRPQMGALVHNHERYEFESLGEDGCCITLISTSTFANGLSRGDYKREITMMSAAVQSSLKKLKLQAEHGAKVGAALAEDVLL